MKFLQEDDLRQPVHQLFESRGYIVSDEVSLFSRKIDVVAKKRNDVITVELKLRNWREALDQARLNLRVSNYSYVALQEPLSRFDSRLFIETIQSGIGLLSVNGTASEIVCPKRSNVIQSNLRRNFLRHLRSELGSMAIQPVL